jgi:Arc/MetJ-type ribon-helix-helix transcriptional regulator
MIHTIIGDFMVNEMVHLRLDPKMRAEIKNFLGDDFFGSETEFIKDAIRRNIELYRKIQVIHSLRGSAKKIKNPPNIPLSEVFRAVGLED